MAARRLIIVLVVLFAISIVAAAVAPDRRPLGLQDEPSTTSTTTDPEPEASSAGGEALSASIEGSAENPETVEASPGDQLALEVAVAGGGQVGIPPLGLLDTAAPDAPAQFNLLLREAGTVPITDAGSGEVIGRVLVSEPEGKMAGTKSDSKGGG